MGTSIPCLGEEVVLPNLTEPLVIPVTQNLFVLFDGISKKNMGFLNKRRSLDSNLPSEMSSRNVETTPLVKRAWRSSFVLIKVGTVSCKLKRRLRSTPLTYPKWFLLVRGFEAYLTAKENTTSVLWENSETTLLESKREAQHMRPVSYNKTARLTWDLRPDSILRKIFSKSIDSNGSLLNETCVQRSEDAESTRLAFNSQARRSRWQNKKTPG